MKIISSEKINSTRTVKLFGLPLMRVEKEKNAKHQNFLGNLITVHKTFKEDFVQKNINVLGINVYKYIREQNNTKYYLFNKFFKEVFLGDKFYWKHRKLFEKYDDIYVLHANIGEAVIFLRLARACFRKNGSKKPLIIGLQNYHKELVNMFLPDVDVIILKKVPFSLYSDTFFTHGHCVRIAFSKAHFDKLEDALRDNNINDKHFIAFILNSLELSKDDFEDVNIPVSKEEKEILLKKVKKIGLDIDNFVFFAPEASTCESVPAGFWEELKDRYQCRGIDVFCNAVKEKEFFKGFKRCSLSMKEVFILAGMAKEIVALRSGLVDLLVYTKQPVKVIYTKARHREWFNSLHSKDIMTGFSLTTFPNVKEFDTEKISKDKLVKVISENL